MDDFLDLLTPVLIVWGVFAVSFLYNRSRLRNCLYLAVALLATVGFVTSLASESGYLPGLVVIFLALLFVLVVPFFLIGNGVIMLRREGRNLANLLSFLVGVIVLLGEAACVYVVLGTVQGTIMPTAMHRLVALFGMSVFYFCCVFLMFITYSKFIEHVPHRRDFDYLIVHGAGLLHSDQVSKLLADRLDKAIEVYSRDPTPPIIITSGGRGVDETVTEAHAMAQYLIDHGIPSDHIVEEGESPDTMANIVNSRRIIDQREGRKRVALISSNYHVYRCLLDARKARAEMHRHRRARGAVLLAKRRDSRVHRRLHAPRVPCAVHRVLAALPAVGVGLSIESAACGRCGAACGAARTWRGRRNCLPLRWKP
ncbi:MAG: YdcF family protein [Bifidobacteriaceae bacterium]|nr:YdcF family protein [Bifidobacteriaceae bacterium]